MPIDDKESRITEFLSDARPWISVSRAYAWYVLMDTPSRDIALAKLLEISAGDNDQAQEAAAVGLGLVDSDSNEKSAQIIAYDEYAGRQDRCIGQRSGTRRRRRDRGVEGYSS